MSRLSGCTEMGSGSHSLGLTLTLNSKERKATEARSEAIELEVTSLSARWPFRALIDHAQTAGASSGQTVATNILIFSSVHTKDILLTPAVVKHCISRKGKRIF